MKRPGVVIFCNASQKPFVNNLLPCVRGFQQWAEVLLLEPSKVPGFVSTGGAAAAGVPPVHIEEAIRFGPDLVVCIGGGLYVDPASRARFSKNAVFAGVALSDPIATGASLQIAPHFDVFYTNDHNSLDAYRNAGVNIHLCRAATDPDLYYPTGAGRDIDLLFYGKWTPWRNELLTSLASRMRLAVHTYETEKRWSVPVGPPLDSPEALREVVSRARVVLEFAIVEDAGQYTGTYRITNRPQIAACCETVALIEDFPEVRDYFEPGKEIETFRDQEELVAKLDGLLADDARRAAIARDARARVIRDATWKDRARGVLDDAARIRSKRAGGLVSRLRGLWGR
jgi:spore maturation protein CgeB